MLMRWWCPSLSWQGTTMGSRSDAGAWQGFANRAGELPSEQLRDLPRCRRPYWRRSCARLRTRRVEFGAVGRQRDFLDTVRPANFAAGMTAAVVKDEPDPVGAGVLAELLQEALKADPVDMRQEQHDAGAAHRFDRGVQPEPMILVVMGPRRAAAERAP